MCGGCKGTGRDDRDSVLKVRQAPCDEIVEYVDWVELDVIKLIDNWELIILL